MNRSACIKYSFPVYFAFIIFSCSPEKEKQTKISKPVVSSEIKPAPVEIILKDEGTPLRSRTVTIKSIACVFETGPRPEGFLENYQHDTVQNKASDMKTLVESLQSPLQSFRINATRDTVLLCSKGTRLAIRANSFQTKSGTPVEGEILFEVKEYLTKSDFILAGLSTMTFSGDVLETGGTLNLKASAEGEELILKEGEQIGLEVPTDNFLPDMKLFYGSHDAKGNLRWEDNRDMDSELNPGGKIVSRPGTYGIKIITEQADVRYTNGDYIYKSPIVKKDKGDYSNPKDYDIDTIDITLTADKNGKIVKTDTRINDRKVRSRVRLYDLDRQLLSRYYYSDYQKKLSFNKSLYLEASVNDVKDPRIRASFFRKLKMENLKNNTVEVHTRQIYARRLRNWRDKERIEEKLASDSSKISTQEAQYYLLNTGKLGWINVDRFKETLQPKFAFNGILPENNYAEVSMVFRNYNGIMPAMVNKKTASFPLVPMNEEVYLVGVKVIDNKAYLCMQETTTAKATSNQKLEFREVDFATLKEAMQKLNQ